MSTVLQGQPTRAVTCYHCHRGFDAAARALTLSCPRCYKPLRLDDVSIKGVHHAARLETCGRLVIERKGWVMAASIYAGAGIELHGALEAKAIVTPTLWVGPKARVRGDIRARALTLELGALVDTSHFDVGPNVGPLTPAMTERAAARMIASDAASALIRAATT